MLKAYREFLETIRPEKLQWIGQISNDIVIESSIMEETKDQKLKDQLLSLIVEEQKQIETLLKEIAEEDEWRLKHGL